MGVLVLAGLSSLALIPARAAIAAIAGRTKQTEQQPAQPSNQGEGSEPEDEAVEDQACDKAENYSEEQHDQLQLAGAGEETQ